jgi:hypothetical protein
VRIIGGAAWLSQQEACEVLGVTPQRVRELANKQGRLQSTRDYGAPLYLRSDVLAQRDRVLGRPSGGRPPRNAPVPGALEQYSMVARVRALEQAVGELLERIEALESR